MARRYTDADQRRLAKLDERHGTLSGPASKQRCERAWQLFGLAGDQRLAGIPVAHLYKLRRARVCQRARRTFDKTRGKVSAIGARRKPQTANRNPMASPVIVG